MQINGKQNKDWGERSGLEKDHEFMFYQKLQIKGPLNVDSKLKTCLFGLHSSSVLKSSELVANIF